MFDDDTDHDTKDEDDADAGDDDARRFQRAYVRLGCSWGLKYRILGLTRFSVA